MATSDVELCNSALQKIGAETITTLSDTTRRAILCNRQYDKIRKKLLRSHPWNFAIKRQYLTKTSDVSSSVDSGTDVFTAATTCNMKTGDRINVVLNSGTMPAGIEDGGNYYAILVTATTFKLATTALNAEAGTAIDVTTDTFNASFFVQSPWGKEQYYYNLPSDCLRPIREEEKTYINWKVEGDRILADQEIFNLMYIADITTTTMFDSTFDELFALMLAKELSYSMVQSITLKKELERELAETLRDTRSFDAQAGTPDELESGTWTNTRY